MKGEGEEKERKVGNGTFGRASARKRGIDRQREGEGREKRRAHVFVKFKYINFQFGRSGISRRSRRVARTENDLLRLP